MMNHHIESIRDSIDHMEEIINDIEHYGGGTTLEKTLNRLQDTLPVADDCITTMITMRDLLRAEMTGIQKIIDNKA